MNSANLHAATKPTVITALPLDITVPGTYVLSKNLSGFLSVHADNVTLDLKGFSITYSPSGNVGAGISLLGADDVVRNGTVICTADIEPVLIESGANSALIANVTLQTPYIAILDYGTGTTIRNCIFNTPNNDGVFCGGTAEVITHCNFSLSALPVWYNNPVADGDVFINNTSAALP